MNSLCHRPSRMGLLALGALLAGCQPAPTPAPAAPAPPVDGQAEACADRLDPICQQLLLYYSIHKELPADLADLKKLDPQQPMECPVSGKPYVYSRQGLRVTGWPGRLILYDAEPCHAGTRWAIQFETPQPGKPVVIRVVRPPEDAILWPAPHGSP